MIHLRKLIDKKSLEICIRESVNAVKMTNFDNISVPKNQY